MTSKRRANIFNSQHLTDWQQVDRYAVLNLLAHLTNLGQSRTTIGRHVQLKTVLPIYASPTPG